jgi:hypothetical protein
MMAQPNNNNEQSNYTIRVSRTVDLYTPSKKTVLDITVGCPACRMPPHDLYICSGAVRPAASTRTSTVQQVHQEQEA